MKLLGKDANTFCVLRLLPNCFPKGLYQFLMPSTMMKEPVSWNYHQHSVCNLYLVEWRRIDILLYNAFLKSLTTAFLKARWGILTCESLVWMWVQVCVCVCCACVHPCVCWMRPPGLIADLQCPEGCQASIVQVPKGRKESLSLDKGLK